MGQLAFTGVEVVVLGPDAALGGVGSSPCPTATPRPGCSR